MKVESSPGYDAPFDLVFSHPSNFPSSFSSPSPPFPPPPPGIAGLDNHGPKACRSDYRWPRYIPLTSLGFEILPLTWPVGFIGRHLALYIHENNLASEVRLVDKVLPQLAWLAPEFEEACSKEKFVQADASRERR